nr:unnamed protein product [Callosobruchus chinensis]
MSTHNAYVLVSSGSGFGSRKNLEKRKTRRKCTKDWLFKRSSLSPTNFLEELRLELGDWHNYLRMDDRESIFCFTDFTVPSASTSLYFTSNASYGLFLLIPSWYSADLTS